MLPSLTPILFILFGLLLASFSSTDASTQESNRELCKNFKCEQPSVADPNLKVDMIYQGNFSSGSNEMSPVSTMTFVGQDMLLLNKNNGTVYKVRNSTVPDVELLDVNVANERERGLLGIESTKAGAGANFQYIFLYYTEDRRADNQDVCPNNVFCEPATNPIGNRLYRYELAGDTLVNPVLLLDLPAGPGPSHNGGVLRIGPDSNLYLTVGDVSGSVMKNSRTKAQNFMNGTEPDGRAGILRVSQDATSAPIVGNATVKFPSNVYFAYGIRNSFGIDFDPVTGNLWDTENGPEFGDEINLVKPGFNSGWVNIQGVWNSQYDASVKEYLPAGVADKPLDLVNLFDNKSTYSAPEFVWKNTIGPTAVKFLTSDKLGKEYENDLFVGSDTIGTIFHFELNNARTGLELDGVLKDRIADSNNELDDIIFAQGFGIITDLDVGPDGYLYVLSKYKSKPTIFRIAPIGET